MSLLVIQFKVSETVEGCVASKKQWVYSMDWTDALHSQRCAMRTWGKLQGVVSAGIALEGAKCCPILATLLIGSGPRGWLSPYFLQHIRDHLLLPLLHQLAALVASPDIASPTTALALPQPAAAGQQQTRWNTADTQGSLQFSLWLCEVSPQGRLAGQYKPDIRFMSLALWVTAGFASSLKLLAAAVGELLARIEWSWLI